jgi:DDE superfamily endonuclease/Helix-turn-helix of DDE superfamily endonuclease
MEVLRILKNNRLAKAMTGLTKDEFYELLPTFILALRVAAKQRRPDRKRNPGAGQKGTLRTAEEKLAFILIYLKIYPTFDVLGYLTGRERTRSCRYTHLLLGVLEDALGKKIVLPERKIRSVEEFFEKFPEARDIFLDGTERPVQRPKDAKKRKKLYSGKKKRTMRKTLILCDEKKRILLLSPTKSGRRHDKRLADKEGIGCVIPPNVALWGDTGFLGMQHQHANTVMPVKSTKKQPLTEEQKSDNRIISSIRVVVEHAIGGMKRMKAAADIYRNRIPNTDDRFHLLSAGIWNFHLQQTQ